MFRPGLGPAPEPAWAHSHAIPTGDPEKSWEREASGKRFQPEGWGGGRPWQAPDGTVTYYIRRKIDGRLYDKSTRATTRAAAEAQLRRFEADPAAYQAGGDSRRPPVFLTNDQAKAFLRWSQVERENSDQWVKKQKAILAWWMEHLKGVDLRRATLQDHILPPLAGPKVHGKSQRIEIIKTFYGWLRKVEHTISAHEDPTYGALPAGQGRPAQHRKSMVIAREHYLLAREHLVGVFRDAKSHRFGICMAHARTSSPERADVLLLLAALALLVSTLLGIAAELLQLHRQLQANSVRNRRVLSLSTFGRLIATSRAPKPRIPWRSTWLRRTAALPLHALA